MRKKLLELAGGDVLLSKAYRIYLHGKHFILYNMGFNIATWYSADNKILSCDVITQETFDYFVHPKQNAKP